MRNLDCAAKPALAARNFGRAVKRVLTWRQASIQMCQPCGTRETYDYTMDGAVSVFEQPSYSLLLVLPSLGCDVPGGAAGAAPSKSKRNTKLVGDISEARVMLALTEAGYAVSKPFGENVRYDLVADDGERLHRVQVKTGRLRNGVIRYNCYSSHAHRGGKARPYFGQVEYLAVYCPDLKKVYLLPEKELTATAAHLRVSPTRNNMRRSIRWAGDFELA